MAKNFITPFKVTIRVIFLCVSPFEMMKNSYPLFMLTKSRIHSTSQDNQHNILTYQCSPLLEQQSHRKIWMDVVKNNIKDLRTLPFSSIYNRFEAHLQDFYRNFSNELESERRNKGETRAVEWLIREVMLTESQWPEALKEVLQAHNKALLEKIKGDFKAKHKEIGKIFRY